MNIPVLLEPTPTGFRASTGAPLNLVAEAPTTDEALAAIRRQFVLKQIAGLRVVSLELPVPDPLLALVARLAEDSEMLNQADAIIKENRQRQADEDAEEDAAEIAKALAVPPLRQEFAG